MMRRPNAAARAAGRVHVHDVHAGAVARDDPAPGKRVDGLRVHVRVLGDDRVRVPGDVDHIVFGLALGGDQLEAGVLDDGPLDVHVVKVVVSDDNGPLLPVCHVLPPDLLGERRSVG